MAILQTSEEHRTSFHHGRCHYGYQFNQQLGRFWSRRPCLNPSKASRTQLHSVHCCHPELMHYQSENSLHFFLLDNEVRDSLDIVYRWKRSADHHSPQSTRPLKRSQVAPWERKMKFSPQPTKQCAEPPSPRVHHLSPTNWNLYQTSQNPALRTITWEDHLSQETSILPVKEHNIMMARQYILWTHLPFLSRSILHQQ